MWTSHWLPILANYSQWLSGFTLLTGLGLIYRKHQCHQYGCPRLAWHPDPETGHPLCKKHHSDDVKTLRKAGQ